MLPSIASECEQANAGTGPQRLRGICEEHGHGRTVGQAVAGGVVSQLTVAQTAHATGIAETEPDAAITGRADRAHRRLWQECRAERLPWNEAGAIEANGALVRS